MENKPLDSLDAEVQALVQESAKARKLAYCMYSKFQVGAALKLSDGSITTGCNVENSSIGLTICAERTAIVRAVAEGKPIKTLEAVAVSAVTKGQLVVVPCGACRQFLAEFNPNVKLYCYNPDTGIVGVTDLNYLLPACFDSSYF